MAEPPGYEQSDFDAARVLMAGALIVAGIIVVASGAWLCLRLNDGHAGGPNSVTAPTIDGPALQSDAPADREAFFRQKEAELSSYGWTDRTHGRVHIPIDQAMQQMAQPPTEPSK